MQPLHCCLKTLFWTAVGGVLARPEDQPNQAQAGAVGTVEECMTSQYDNIKN
jgi:hypothetical protein